MSKFQDSVRYYLLVASVGLLAASFAIGFYLLYQEIWRLTQRALAYSIVVIIPLSLLAIGVPYLLVRRFAKTKATGSGTHTVLEAYHLANGEVSIEDTIVKPTAAMLTIGLGGSAGPEGPSLLAGGGIASAISRRFKIKADLRRRLFVAGAAAGLAATFRTPLTAILFALEIPYKNDLDRETFIEATVASVPAYLLAVALLGSEPFFGVVRNMTISLNEIALSLLLGLICGLYAVFFTRMFSWAEQFTFKLRKKTGNLSLICVAAAFISVSAFVSLYTIGVGLNFTSALITSGSLSFVVLLVVVILKTFLTTVTLNFGGSGGLFFPTIVIGAGIGYIFGQLFSVDFTIMFIAVGMAALLGGTHKVLLTPVAFVVETLGGIFAIPALLATGVSYLLSGNNSFYQIQPRTKLRTEELALERFYVKAEKLASEKMQNITAEEVMTKNPISLRQGATVKTALEVFEGTKLRVLPVTDDHNHVIGVINLEDIGYVDVQRHSVSLSETIMHNPILISGQTSMKQVAQRMIENQQDHIFVVDKSDALTGVISGIDVVKKIIEILSF
jgi:CIC family chloride channel protein